jgi:hypothetical protein
VVALGSRPISAVPKTDATSATQLATVVIEARDLDTDRRASDTLDVCQPNSPAEQRLRLAEATAKFYPAARFKSFAHGAATFLDRQHLIVAFYADPQTESDEGLRDRRGTQEPLFST